MSEEIITGLVAPCDWDEQGNVSAVVIALAGEEEYIVRPGECVPQLLNCLHTWIEAHGCVVVEENGTKSICVTRFICLPATSFAGTRDRGAT